MENEPSGRDPKEIWQQQAPEKCKVSLEQLRLRAQQLAVKMRVQFFAVSGIAVLIIGFDVWNFRSSPYSFQRAGFTLSAAWALYTLIEVGQNVWPGRLGRDAGWLTCLAFSRNELQRQLNYSSYIRYNLAGPILFTLLVVVAPSLLGDRNSQDTLLKGAPALILLIIWLVIFRIMRKRERQKLRTEIEELSGLDNDLGNRAL